MLWVKLIKYGLWAIAGLIIIWSIYATVWRPHTKPNPTTTNKADVIYNYTIQPRSTFGCSAFLIRREDGKEIQLENKDTANSVPSSSGGNPLPDGRVGELAKTS